MVVLMGVLRVPQPRSSSLVGENRPRLADRLFGCVSMMTDVSLLMDFNGVAVSFVKL